MLSKAIRAEKGAIACEQPLASMTGYDVLRGGGNAFDAAVAASFVLSVTLHPAGGVGGDFFGMLYEAKTGKVHCINSSGWSPSGLTPEVATFNGTRGIPRFGPMTCMVPGFVAGLWEMNQKFGSEEFRELLSPSIEYAAKGFPAGEGLCKSTSAAFDELTGDARKVFAPSGRPPVPGDWIRQEALGRTISDVAESGPDSFYSGDPAERIREKLEALGLHSSPGDFDFTPEWVPPLSLDYNGTRVYEVPPNSMGATSLLILKQLSEGRLAGAGPLSGKRIEATMDGAVPAYARRDEMLGDPRFEKVDVLEFLNAPLAAGARGSRVNPGDTTAFSVADSEGNLVSGIQSLFNHFGSRVFVPECGIMLNNRGSGFSLSGPNSVAPRKRPLHTLSSMILEREGRPYLAIGASGGDHRPLQHAQFVTNAVDYSMSVERNVGHPRFLWSGKDTIMVEEGYELPTSSKFKVQGLPMPGPTGVCQAVEVSDRCLTAVCDFRGDGLPAGY